MSIPMVECKMDSVVVVSIALHSILAQHASPTGALTLQLAGISLIAGHLQQKSKPLLQNKKTSIVHYVCIGKRARKHVNF